MVRVLSCHHFSSQKVGRCDGGIGLTVAEQIIILAQESIISIYAPESISNISLWFSKKRNGFVFGKGGFGSNFTWPDDLSSIPPPPLHQQQKIPKSPDKDKLILHHSISPVDFINSITYNQKGHYLLCVERRESIGDLFRVRIYFNWDKPSYGRPMKARIAGLVLPTGGEVDSDSLTMIEIPPEPLFRIIATNSCINSGNIANLSSDGRVSVYLFRLKDGGRGKGLFPDFDLILTLQVIGFIPSSLSISLNHIATFNQNELRIFKIQNKNSIGSSPPPPPILSPIQHLQPNTTKEEDKKKKSDEDIIYFNRKETESIQLILPTIVKENKKRNQVGGLIEEEININKTIISHGKNFTVNDILKIGNESKSTKIKHLTLHTIRIKSVVGGSLCLLGTDTEMIIYYLPETIGRVLRITHCPFTGPLQCLFFDNFFIHALTDNGLETYSSRGIGEAFKNIESFSHLNNDCPLQYETPCLLGIKPFPGVQYFGGNESYLSLMSQPTTINTQSTSNEHSTLYLLECPSIDEFVDESLRVGEAHKDSSPDSTLTLLSEAHLVLRIGINRKIPGCSKDKYKEINKLLGLGFIQKSTTIQDQLYSDEILNKGLTFLKMGDTDPKFFFKHENQDIPRDPQLIRGISKYLRYTLPLSYGDEFPPSLSRAIVYFLSVNSTGDLARVALETPWIREAQGQKIINSLESVVNGDWRRDVGLILSIVSLYGRDTEAVTRVTSILNSSKNISNIFKEIRAHWILERKKGKFVISDLGIVLSVAESNLHIHALVIGIENGYFNIQEVIRCFQQSINLNADSEVKECLSNDLKRIIELYFLRKYQNNTSIQNNEEISGIHFLISSYLGNIFNTKLQGKRYSIPINEPEYWNYSESDKELFGPLPSFIKSIIEDYPFINSNQQTHFIGLSSLLCSNFGEIEGVKDIVIRSLINEPDTPITYGLNILSQSISTSIDLILNKRPELLLIYGKEEFNNGIEEWKILVDKLKIKIKTNPPNKDMILTLTEGVYLHLANTLNPSELEQVLLKEDEEKGRIFLSVSNRIHLANGFSDKVSEMSKKFLSRV